MPSKERKAEYFERLKGLLASNSKLFIVHADHVGSLQFQKIRLQLRGVAEVIMGKNTMMRKVIQTFLDENVINPGTDEEKQHWYKSLLPLVRGNIGFIFVDKDIQKVRDVINDNIVPAPARAGVVANKAVIVPAGVTPCDPSMTNFFQALDVPTKINKGMIEILNDQTVCREGEKVTAGAAALLNKLDIRPFSYGLIITHVFDHGAVYDPCVLDLDDEAKANRIRAGVRNLAAVSMAIDYPTLASVPHMLSKALQRMVSVVVAAEGEYKFEQCEETLAYLADPSAFAAPAAAGEEEKEEEKEEEEEEEEEEVALNMGGDEDDDAW